MKMVAAANGLIMPWCARLSILAEKHAQFVKMRKSGGEEEEPVFVYSENEMANVLLWQEKK